MLGQYQQAIEKYRQRVFSFAFYSLRIREDAEDITQDVFIRLWQHWQKVDQSRIGAWLMRVAHNLVVDHVRKNRGVKVPVEQAEATQELVAVDNLELATRDFRSRLETAIAELSEPYRSIVIMRDIQGLSYTEIELSLDLNQSQVKVYLHRARRRLREEPVLRQLAMESEIISDAGQAQKKTQVPGNDNSPGGDMSHA